MDYTQSMRDYISTEIRVLQNLDIDELNRAANAIIDCRDRGGMIYTIGNGGSAATASHMVVDFEKGANECRKDADEANAVPFKFECLADNTPIMTALANDISYEDVFVFQLRKKLRPEDLLIAISGSGNSKNIIKAVEYAKSIGTKVVGLTGYNGGKLAQMSDYRMHVNIDDMQVTEDVHMMFDHMLLRIFTL